MCKSPVQTCRKPHAPHKSNPHKGMGSCGFQTCHRSHCTVPQRGRWHSLMFLLLRALLVIWVFLLLLGSLRRQCSCHWSYCTSLCTPGPARKPLTLHRWKNHRNTDIYCWTDTHLMHCKAADCNSSLSWCCRSRLEDRQNRHSCTGRNCSSTSQSSGHTLAAPRHISNSPRRGRRLPTSALVLTNPGHRFGLRRCMGRPR